jgi:hypothetical protein
MVWRALMISSLVTLLVIAAAPPTVAPPLEALFAPLRWDTRVENVHRAFPGTSVDVRRLRGPERLLAVVTGAKTSALGDVMVTVEGDGKGRLHLIKYSFDDRRPGCKLGGIDPQKVPAHLDCAWRKGPTAMETLRRWERMVRKELGAPTSGPEQADDGVFLKWRRPGHDAFLSLTQGDDGLWEISLTAQRPYSGP